MQDEFSLAHYVALIRRRWRSVAAVLLITLLAAAVFSLLQPVTYEGEAVLATQPPKYTWRLDVNFQTMPEDLRLDRRNEYATFISDKALGRDLARAVIAKLGDRLPADLRDPKQLQREANVRSASGRLVYLTATAPTPELAQALTNAWADAWIALVDARYGQGTDQAKFQTELELAQVRLDAATTALKEFQARTGLALEMGGDLAAMKEGALAAAMPLLQQRLVLNNSSLADYQAVLDRIHLLQDRARTAQAAGAAISTLPLELLDAPLLVQRGQLTAEQVRGLNSDIAALLRALETEEKSLALTAARLQAETNTIQTELAAQIQERNLLIREYSLSEEAVRALQRKVTEINIQQEIVGPTLVLLNPAPLPQKKATPNWPINLAAGLMLGGLGGIALALGIEMTRRKA